MLCPILKAGSCVGTVVLVVVLLDLLSYASASHEALVSAQGCRVSRAALLTIHRRINRTRAASGRAAVVRLRTGRTSGTTVLHRVDHASLTRRRLTRHIHDFLTGARGSSTRRPIDYLTVVRVVVDCLTTREVIVLHDNDFSAWCMRVLVGALLPTTLLHTELLC